MGRTRAVLTTVGALALLVNGGVAAAYWQSGATGSTASGAAGSVVTLAASAVPVGNATLYPGVTRSLRVTVRNDNSFAVRVGRVRRVAVGAMADPAHTTAGCRQSGVSVTEGSYAVSWSVRARSAAAFTLPDAITMTDVAESACQGATFRLPLVVTGLATPG